MGTDRHKTDVIGLGGQSSDWSLTLSGSARPFTSAHVIRTSHREPSGADHSTTPGFREFSVPMLSNVTVWVSLVKTSPNTEYFGAMAQTEPELLTTREAAAYLRRSRKTLDDWRYRDTGPAYIGGGRGTPVLYRRTDLDAWIESQRVDPSKVA